MQLGRTLSVSSYVYVLQGPSFIRSSTVSPHVALVYQLCYVMIGFKLTLFGLNLVQLTLDRAVGGNEAESLNGYMVAPREDTGTPLGPDVAYVGSWELGTDMKLICNGVSASKFSQREISKEIRGC